MTDYFQCELLKWYFLMAAVEDFMHWRDAQHQEKGSRMDEAVTYLRNRKDTIMAYLKDS